MPVTRHMEQDGFKHIMENVLKVTAETREALKQQGIDTIPDLLNKPFDILDKLDYYPMVTDNDGNQTPSRSKKHNTIRPPRQPPSGLPYDFYSWRRPRQRNYIRLYLVLV